MIEWVLFPEEPREDCRRLQEPDQRTRMLRQVKGRQPVGVSQDLEPDDLTPACDKTCLTLQKQNLRPALRIPEVPLEEGGP